MFSFLKNLFSKSVDSIIADITSKVEQLHVVAEVHDKAISVHNAEIALRTKLASEARAEWTRAKSIAAKFEALVS